MQNSIEYEILADERHAADGALGGTAQKVGGPLDKGGMIGKHFNADGKIGGAVQENIANQK